MLPLRMKTYGTAAFDEDHGHAVDDDDLEECKDEYVDDVQRQAGEREKLRLRQKQSQKSAAIPCPHAWWSYVFFSWCRPLAERCAQRPLRFDDLWALKEEDTSEFCANQLKRALTKTSSVVFAVCCTQWKLLMWSGVISLVSVACELLGPIAVYIIVDSAATHQMRDMYSRGAFWTLMLLGSRFLRSYSLAWADYLLRFVEARTSGALQVLLLESVLVTNCFRSPRVEISEGAPNLFTTDISAVGNAFRTIHRLWMLPLELFGFFTIFRFVAGRVITSILFVSFIIYSLIQLANWSESSLYRQWLSISDQRFGILQRIFQNILALKLNTWEEWALTRIMTVRSTEQFVLKRHVLLRTIRYTLTWIAPSLNLIATGALLLIVPNYAFASPAFTFSAVAIFHAINDAFVTAVGVIQVFLQFRVSLERIYAVLQLSHTPSNKSSEPTGRTHSLGNADEDAVAVASAVFANPTSPEAPDLLTNVNIRVKRGEFVVIHGKVGCGKSVFLSALLGFLPKKRGGVYLNGSVAYCSQVPWIQSMTIRDNILFGKEFDEVRYWSVLEACCLIEDLTNLPAGDRTIIGSHGLVSMSGGQQARVALARACYADADIYILDAPLDSVDSIVQCEILLKCMGQLLHDKTIILSTHNPELILCEYVDRAILVEQMVIQEPKLQNERRQPRTLSRRAAAENRSVPRAFVSKRKVLLGDAATRGGLVRKRKDAPPASSTTEARTLRLNRSVLLNPLVLKLQSAPRSRQSSTPNVANHASCAYRRKGWSAVLKEYIAYTQSVSVLCIVIFLHHMTQVLSTMSVYYFSRWIGSCGDAENSPEAMVYTDMLFKRYLWTVGGSCVSFLCAAFATFSFSLTAAGKLFECMTSALLHAPMRFFSTNSVGKILNRYARDLKSVDSSLQGVIFTLLRSFFSTYCSLFASLAWLSGHVLKGNSFALQNDAMSMVIWWVVMIANLVVTTGILGAFWRDGIESNKPSGEIYLMFRETLSPMFNYVTESMNGRRVIAAFGSEQRLRVARNYGEKVDQATRILISMWTFETWVAIRCLLMESLLTSSLLIALIAFGHDPSYSNQPATIGLLLFLLLNIRDDMKNSFANWNLLEKDLACVQRILEYIDVEPEGALSQNQLPLDPFWPRKGSITFHNVFFQYDGADAHPPTNTRANAVLTGAMALKNVSFHIDGGQKIGVVGRSGAGKSSLAMALMRVNDPAYGVIQIDGVDVTRLHLKTLRSKVSYVPPNPVFTNSSLREYLDPMNHVEDAVLWKILKKTGVEASILKVQASLDAPITGMLSNWSTGERQLLCLARALVFRSRIVILDEATTATDQETDCSVQDLVYEILDSSTTLLCIAHRLDTVLEFDKILVMADGGVEDFGTVQELVASGDGVFYNLLESAQLVY
ncbi:Canalicular multispecific organic anion transporter 2, partial [Globisporangium splendens]